MKHNTFLFIAVENAPGGPMPRVGGVVSAVDIDIEINCSTLREILLSRLPLLRTGCCRRY